MPRAGGPPPRPLGGDPGQPECQDRRKRGPRGFDAGKKIKGRKRHLLVDSDGLLLACHVHPADVQGRAGAKLLLRRRRLGFCRRHLRLVWYDSGYWGAPFAAWVRARWPRVEVVALCRHATLPNRKVPGQPGSVRLPRRWVIERTFAWLGRWRRTSKDYEANPRSSEAWLYLAMTGLMLRRLEP